MGPYQIVRVVYLKGVTASIPAVERINLVLIMYSN